MQRDLSFNRTLPSDKFPHRSGAGGRLSSNLEIEEEANNWFDMLGMENSPHMMYALDTLPDAKSKIPAVVHVDGTCRVQTINCRQNKHFYELIRCFFSATGVPMLLNTSFNLAGHPMVESISDALYTLRNSNLEYLYLPDIKKLIIIKNRTTEQ